jgi:hypothetical protein
LWIVGPLAVSDLYCVMASVADVRSLTDGHDVQLVRLAVVDRMSRVLSS